MSVVIPTRHRPRLLARALASALAQTVRAIEVIVVVDGPDPETVAMLEGISDPRVAVMALPTSLTAAGARNAGVSRACAPWVALLDDDDEWLPRKLERQLAAAPKGPALITCLSRIMTPDGESVWPTRIYDNAEPLDRYLWGGRAVFAGSAYIQSSSLLLPKALYEQQSFPVGSAHDDWEFVMRLRTEQGATIVTVPEELVRVHVGDARPSLTSATAWQSSLGWAETMRPLLTPRGYSGLLLGVVAPRAADARALRALPLLLHRAVRHGAPDAMQLLRYLALWSVPPRARRHVRLALTSRRRTTQELSAHGPGA